MLEQWPAAFELSPGAEARDESVSFGAGTHFFSHKQPLPN